MTFQVRRKNEVTKCNNLKIIKKSVTKPNIIEKQKTQGLKKHAYVQGGWGER